MPFIYQLSWLILPLTGLGRSTFLFRRSARVLKNVRSDTYIHVIRVMRSNRFRAGLRIAMMAGFLCIEILAPLCAQWISAELRIGLRNGMLQAVCLLVFMSAESDAFDYRYLDSVFRPGAVGYVKEEFQ